MIFIFTDLLNNLKERIEGFQQTTFMMFTRMMDKLSKFERVSNNVDTTHTDDPSTYNEALSTISKIPCESVDQLKSLNEAMAGNEILTKLLV